MKLKQTAIASCLAALLAFGANATFEKTKTYEDGQFTDVYPTEWYASEVKSTYELGLMNGIGGGLFNPDGNVTVAEAITMACRASAINAGETIPEADGEWYQMYVNYAVSKGFISEGQFDNYDRPAKRYEVACIFENAMPDGYFAEKNAVNEIPDVSEAKDYHTSLLTLYKAGVVMGSDSYGNFRPEDNITRAEAAAIITRVAIPENRLSKTLEIISADDAYVIDMTDDFTVSTGTSGVVSSWLYDNRGGVMLADYRANLEEIIDDSEKEGIALIREFNKTETGKIRIETEINAVSTEGIYLEVRNTSDKAIYRLEIKDGAWQIWNADGSYTRLVDAKPGKTAIYADIDLDNLRAITSLNGEAEVNNAVSALTVDKSEANAINMRFATTAAEKPRFSVTSSNINVNYGVYDMFHYEKDDSVPVGWTVSGASVVNGELAVSENGSAQRIFTPVSGKVISEVLVFANSKTKASYSLLSGTKIVAELELDGKSFILNGEKVYDYHDGLWYQVRFELDTDNEELIFKLNGREIKSGVAFKEKTTSIDGILISGKSAEKVKFDNFTVFEKKIHDDYVPVPVKPDGADKYNVGAIVCSLWEEGSYTGWKSITPYDRPVLGYYDEGTPETADWEIKYMVEHGINFQAVCWFPDADQGYIKTPRLSGMLNKGYMNAEYSHMMSYALLLECASQTGDLESWKKYTVPYIIEYYLKDSRYMRVDNKAVICAYDTHKWTWDINFGSVDAMREAFDYLEDEAKKLGYDGIIYLSCHSGLTPEENVKAGIDGVFHYSFGYVSHRLDMNIHTNESVAAQEEVYVVPTIFMGYNGVAWEGWRAPIMSADDFYTGNKWVVDTYIPKYAEKGTWQETLVFLSDWNEYGGTYISPCENNGVFGYLDAVRKAYTNEEPDESINTIPTEEQLRRINRKYPQYRQDLKADYNLDLSVQKEVVASIDPADIFDTILAFSMKDLKMTDEGLQATISGNDPRFRFEDLSNYTIPTSEVAYISVNMKVPKDSVIELFFATDNDPKISQGKSMSLTATSDDFANYMFEIRKNAQWNGNVTAIWIDPIREINDSNRDYLPIIKSIDFLSPNDVGITKTIPINGLETEARYHPVLHESGDLLLPFDLDYALEYRLDTFVLWDKATKTLTINGENSTLAFTVGSDICLINGKEYKLAYAIDTIDNYPLLPIKLICETLGYTYDFDNMTGIIITIPGCETLYENMSDMSWDFNLPGYFAGWSSSNTKLTISSEGALVVNASDADPRVTKVLENPVPAKDYEVVEIRARFDGKPEKGDIEIFFATDSNDSFHQSRCIYFVPNKTSTDGDWWVGKVYLSGVSGWSGNITQLRLDPFNATGITEIDYIKFRKMNEDELAEKKAKEEEIAKRKEEAAKEEAKNADSANSSFASPEEEQKDDGKSVIWSFNGGKDDLGGWNERCSNYEMKNLSGETLLLSATGNDPYMYYTFETPIKASDFKEFKIRTTIDFNETYTAFQFFWTTSESPGVSESKSFWIEHKKMTTLGEYVELTYDLSSHSEWKGEITSVRIDAFNRDDGLFEIDYIKLQAKNTEGSAEETAKEDSSNSGSADTSSAREAAQKDDGKSVIWSFNGGKGDLGGWNTKFGNYEMKNLSGETMVLRSIGNDPYMYYTFETPIKASDFKEFKICTTIDINETYSAFQFFWTTSESPGVSESKSFWIEHKKMTTLGEYVELTYDLSSHSEWKGEITSIRIDAVNRDDGLFEIDYIKLQAK